jgi:peroxiredoxin
VETSFYASYVVLWLLVGFQTLILLGLVRQYARGTEPPTLSHDLPFDDRLTGRPIPRFSAQDVSGTQIDDATLTGLRTAILFVAPDCQSCSATLDELQALELKVDGRVVLVCRATQIGCRELSAKYGFDGTVVVDPDGAISALFGVNGTPTAVIVSDRGMVETYGHPMRGADIEALFAESGVHA